MAFADDLSDAHARLFERLTNEMDELRGQIEHASDEEMVQITERAKQIAEMMHVALEAQQQSHREK